MRAGNYRGGPQPPRTAPPCTKAILRLGSLEECIRLI